MMSKKKISVMGATLHIRRAWLLPEWVNLFIFLDALPLFMITFELLNDVTWNILLLLLGK